MRWIKNHTILKKYRIIQIEFAIFFCVILKHNEIKNKLQIEDFIGETPIVTEHYFICMRKYLINLK